MSMPASMLRHKIYAQAIISFSVLDKELSYFCAWLMFVCYFDDRE